MRKPRRILAYGPSAFLLEWEQLISPEINRAVHNYTAAIRSWPEVIDCVPAYASLVLTLKAGTDPGPVEDRLYCLVPDEASTSQPITHRIPVYYGAAAGPDLAFIAERARLSEAEVVEIHAAGTYQVYQLGYQPGFGFLGLLDERLATPRRPTPRISVPAGSVGIAGLQTAIYPQAAAGGWQLLGRCPIPMVRPEPKSATDISLLKAGDFVKFEPISETDFFNLLAKRTAWKS